MTQLIKIPLKLLFSGVGSYPEGVNFEHLLQMNSTNRYSIIARIARRPINPSNRMFQLQPLCNMNVSSQSDDGRPKDYVCGNKLLPYVQC